MNETWQQAPFMGGLMNGGGQQPSVPPSLMNYQPGQWSQLAYQMAGSPRQGPYPSVATPPAPQGLSANSGGGGGIGGTALGILGALAKNPQLLKSAGNGISSLLSGATPSGATALTASQLSPVGTGAVDAAANGAMADATGALGGGTGLMGGDVALSDVGTGAVDATANAGMADAGAALGDSAGLGALGASAAGVGGVLAIPLVTNTVVNALSGLLDKNGVANNELGLLNTSRNSGITERSGSGVTGGSFGLGGTPQEWYGGQNVTAALTPANLQRATDLLKAGNMAAYTQFMQSLSPTPQGASPGMMGLMGHI